VSIREVRVGVQRLTRFRGIVSRKRLRRILRVADEMQRRLAKRVVWNVNSTAVGGGVAEMLQSLLAYTRSAGIDTRWIVISGNPEFFRITKRIHHALHGSPGDGSPLDEAAREAYEQALEENARELAALVRPDDVVILHDPQTAGLTAAMREAGARVIWRCHIGLDTANEEADRGWAFLAPYLRDAEHYIFSRRSYVPDPLDHGMSTIIQPSIDAFSAKNQEMDDVTVHSILVHTGLVDGPPPDAADHCFTRDDGSPSRVTRRAEVVRSGRAPAFDTPLVVQVSRWDPLKDMLGVMHGFARLCEHGCRARPELVLAGPDVKGVTDDPEGAAVFEEVQEAWRGLPDPIRERVHLVSLPTVDVQENAAIVNALQRHAAVVVQKSLHEGFGLTVTEAMWKARPVVASRVGGIQDQIEDGVNGLLLDDPTDLGHLAEVIAGLFDDPARMDALGRAAREHVRAHFLGIDHLLKYAELLDRLDERAR